MPLFVVATPIGNLDDITLRAMETLRNIDLIACEDTRHSKILLNKIGSSARTVSFHQHSGGSKLEFIIDELLKGTNIALITDAGTPGISDPGGNLIAEAIEKKIEVRVIPGPSAFLAALSLSGFDTTSFIYLGFLPHKKGRQTILSTLQSESRTVVFYESVHRINKLLLELDGIIPNRQICVCRELTKKFEEVYRGTASEIATQVKAKGEFVVIVSGKDK